MNNQGVKQSNADTTPTMKPSWCEMKMFLMVLVAIVLSMLVLLQGAEARTITVDDDGNADYESIQDAIDNATNGDTVKVRDGYYQENILVNKSISLIGGGSDTTTIDGGTNWNVVRVVVDWVNISGFNIITDENNSDGIILWYSDNCIIINNTCKSNHHAISLSHSNNCTITNNRCYNNWFGIYLDESDFCTMENNECSSNEFGFYIICSKSCSITNNTCMNNNQDGIKLDGSGGIIENNTCCDNEFGLDLNWFSGTVENNTCSSNENSGIMIGNVYGCAVILYNTCSNNYLGIYIVHAYDAVLMYNNCSLNNDIGILLRLCVDCIVENNTGTIEVDNEWNYGDNSIFDGECLLMVVVTIILGLVIWFLIDSAKNNRSRRRGS